MKTTLKGILIGVILLVVRGQAFAYPPDNAAVLYYKAILIMEEPNDALEKMLRQLLKDDSGVNKQVRLWLEDNRDVIREIVTAAQIKNCDWGHDFSQGGFMPLPHLKKIKDVGFLLTADAEILSEKGDYKTAIERCITMHKMGIHLGDDILIQKLVGSAISALANKCITEILLPQISGDCETLEWLRAQLAEVSSKRPSIGAAIGSDAVLLGNSFNREVILEMANHPGEVLSKDDQDKLNRILNEHNNDEFYAGLGAYYQGIMSRACIAYDLPYPQAKQKLEDLCREVKNAAKEKPEAYIAQILFPEQTFYNLLNKETLGKTQFNAVLAGIEIYIVRAQTGKLPDELPAGLPKDMFSGKDFLYEKTNAGFVLNGQGKDLGKDIVQKYEFKVAK